MRLVDVALGLAAEVVGVELLGLLAEDGVEDGEDLVGVDGGAVDLGDDAAEGHVLAGGGADRGEVGGGATSPAEAGSPAAAGAGGVASLRGVGSGVEGVPGWRASGLAFLPPVGIWTAGRAASPAPTVPPLPSAVPDRLLTVPLRGPMKASGVSGRGAGDWLLGSNRRRRRWRWRGRGRVPRRGLGVHGGS